MNKSRQRLFYSLGVLTCALPLALSTSSISKGNAEGLFDYSNGTHVAFLGGGDLLAKSGTEIDQREVNYLNANNSLSLAYSEAFLDDDVRTSVVDDKLYIFAHEKSYKDQNNRQWTWTPVSLETNPKTMFVNYDNLYVAQYDDTSINNLKINYQLELSVAPEVLNSYRNKAYQDALSLDNIYQKYLDDEAYYERRPDSEDEYQTQLAEYEQYLEDYQAYLNKEENYEAYLISKAKYEEDLAKYNEYLSAKQQYEADVIACKQNQEDWAYYLANHEQNLKEYNEFGIKYENSRYQLSAMQIAYEQDTARSSSLSQYMLSSTVESVLARKDELTVLGVPSDLVDAADSATVKLRTCFREYDELDSDEARYSYYYINYNYIKSNANILLRSLERLGRYPSVRNVAEDRGKLPQFNTLIFQLIYFCNAISDTVVYNYEAFNPVTGKGDMSKAGAAILDENFVMDGATYKSWLKGYEFIDTAKTATPTTGILPTQQVVLIPEPPTLPVPVEPTAVSKPVAPSVVTEPTEPDEVLEPIPYDPDAVPPDFPSILENQINHDLLNAYLQDKVSERDVFTDPIDITLDGSREIIVNEHLSNVAIFHDYQDNPTQFVFFTSGVEYNGEVPTHPADEQFTEYHFTYWTNELGDDPVQVDLRTISESVNLYPVFDHGERQRYDITWIYPDGNEVTNVAYGTIPSAPRLPLKEETDDHYYVFSNWSPVLSEVTGEATYEAIFEEKDIFDITYNIDGNEVVQREKEDYMPNAPQNLQLSSGTYYVVTGWEEPLSSIEENTTYHATFDKYYTITWKILDQEPYTERYLAGSPVSYKGNIPDPILEELYYKEFQFDQALGYANDNRTITATYVNHAYQSVVLKVDGNTVPLERSYIEGEEIDKPTSYNSAYYHYDITGWNKNGNTYYAVYTKTRLIGDDIYFGYVGETMKIDPSLKHLNSVDLGYLFTKMKENEVAICPIKIVFDDGEIVLTATQVKYLALKGAVTIGIEFNDLGNRSYSLKVYVHNGSGEDIIIDDFFPEVTLNKNVDYLHSQVYLHDEEVNASLTYGCVKLRAQINETYEIIPTYSVLIRASNSVAIDLNQEQGRVGDKIHLSYIVQKGYKLVLLSARTRGGKSVTIDSNNDIVLPADDVVVNFVCEKVQYTLKLYVDDALYASYLVNYGDTVNLPTYIKKVGDETFEYLFTGWGINAETISLTEDTELHAEFIKVEREQKSEKKTSNIVKIAGYVAVGTLVAGLGVGLFFIFKKISKH